MLVLLVLTAGCNLPEGTTEEIGRTVQVGDWTVHLEAVSQRPDRFAEGGAGWEWRLGAEISVVNRSAEHPLEIAWVPGPTNVSEPLYDEGTRWSISGSNGIRVPPGLPLDGEHRAWASDLGEAGANLSDMEGLRFASGEAEVLVPLDPKHPPDRPPVAADPGPPAGEGRIQVGSVVLELENLTWIPPANPDGPDWAQKSKLRGHFNATNPTPEDAAIPSIYLLTTNLHGRWWDLTQVDHDKHLSGWPIEATTTADRNVTWSPHHAPSSEQDGLPLYLGVSPTGPFTLVGTIDPAPVWPSR